MHTHVAILTVAVIMSGCTSFSTVRSAEVHPGPSAMLHASVSTPPGDETAWFWAYDCPRDCNRVIGGADLGATWGWSQSGLGGRAVAVGVGINGTIPYVDGYLQVVRGARPFGIGARLGIPVDGWGEHQFYARQDFQLGRSTRLLLNPALFVHRGHSPNGENPGSFVAFVQGVGILIEGERLSVTPSASFVAGRAERTSYGERFGPTRSVFGTASVAVTYHRPQARQ
jgi:hypothetical protein